MHKLRFTQIQIGMSWTEVVKFLILSNVTIFAAQELFGLHNLFAYNFGLVPKLFFAGKVWQLVTYMFLHGGLGHIFFNMLALWMFGSVLEREWGSGEFLKYYLIIGLGGGLCYALFNPGSIIPTVGASGAIYGLLLAYAVLYPDAIIYVYFVIPLKAKWFALIFGAIELLFSLRGSDGIAHLAHLGGMAFGFLYLKRHRIFGRRWGRRSLREKWEDAARKRENAHLEKLRRDVDALLDKINRQGYDSLTDSERKRLDEASRILRDQEGKRG